MKALRNKHMWILLVVLILCVFAAFIIWQYDLLITTLQIAIISSLIIVLSLMAVFTLFFKDRVFKKGGQTMPSVENMVKIYNKYYENEVTLRDSIVQRKSIRMNEQGDMNDFVAIFAPLKDPDSGGGKVIYWNITIGDIWEILDRPQAVSGKSVNLFSGWKPSYDNFTMNYPKKESSDWMPLGIPKEKGDFDTSSKDTGDKKK